jgi:hypothetical protein
MKLQLEFYQKVIMVTDLGFILFVLAPLLRNNYLYISAIILMAPGCLLGALLVLTNITRKEIVLNGPKPKQNYTFHS